MTLIGPRSEIRANFEKSQFARGNMATAVRGNDQPRSHGQGSSDCQTVQGSV